MFVSFLTITLRKEFTILKLLLSINNSFSSIIPKIQPNIVSYDLSIVARPCEEPTNGIVKVVSLVASLNTASPTYSILLPSVNSVINWQFSKAYFSTLVNESGRVVIWSLIASLNVPSLKVLIWQVSSNENDTIDEVLLNAYFPIVVTLLDTAKSIKCTSLHPSNA